MEKNDVLLNFLKDSNEGLLSAVNAFTALSLHTRSTYKKFTAHYAFTAHRRLWTPKIKNESIFSSVTLNSEMYSVVYSYESFMMKSNQLVLKLLYHIRVDKKCQPKMTKASSKMARKMAKMTCLLVTRK